MQPQGPGSGSQYQAPPSAQAPGAPGAPGSVQAGGKKNGMQTLGLGCGVFALLTLCGNALTLILLVTRVLKHTFHIRMATANALGVGSLVGIGMGILGIIGAAVILFIAKKQNA